MVLSISKVIGDFDYTFAENGLTAFKNGKALPSQSFIKFVGEERYKAMVQFILHYIADLDIPIKRYAVGYFKCRRWRKKP
jgi:phosphomannomutase